MHDGPRSHHAFVAGRRSAYQRRGAHVVACRLATTLTNLDPIKKTIDLTFELANP